MDSELIKKLIIILVVLTAFIISIQISFGQCDQQEWTRIFPKDSTYKAPCNLVIQSIYTEAKQVGEIAELHNRIYNTNTKAKKLLELKDSLDVETARLMKLDSAKIAVKEQDIKTLQESYEGCQVALSEVTKHYRETNAYADYEKKRKRAWRKFALGSFAANVLIIILLI